MIIRFVFVLLLCFSVVMPQQPAQANILEFFFPSLRDTTNDPANTLKAPFADAEQAEQTDAEAKIVENTAVPLDKPHRVTSDITEWVEVVASEVMSFSENHVEELEASKHFYDEGGRSQYEAFLTEKKIKNVLASGKYVVRSYVADTPLLLNEGAVQGRYRWLYEVPLMVSYMERGVTDYKDVEPVNQSMVLRMQIGRAAEAKADLGLRIERWSGKVQKLDKK